jgi:diguanylate cyclase (GGDEF)-like protein
MAAGFGLAVFLAGQFADHDEPHGCGDAAAAASPESFEAMLSAEPDAKEREEAVPPVRDEEPAAEEQNDMGVSRDLEEADDFPDNSVMADLDAAVLAVLGEGALVESAGEALSSHQEDGTENQGDEALLTFQSQLASFCEELIALDEQLRRKPPREKAELKSHLDTLAESNNKQDEVCLNVEQSLREMITAEAIDAMQGEAMIAAIREERQGAAEAVESFGDFDKDGEVATQRKMVLDRTASLLDANYGLRDSMSAMISSTDPQGGEDGGGNEIDPLTEVWSRATLGGMLAEHWRKDPHRARPVSFTVIDLDGCAELNRRHGAAIGDRVLRAVAQLLESESPPDYRVGRFAGQRFALLAIDRDLKRAVGDAERLRQTIEMVRFEYRGDDLKLTVSCGVVSVTPGDTEQSLYARAVESVQEAKRYGRNRCFMHEGEFPTPVVPPKFAMNEKHVAL